MIDVLTKSPYLLRVKIEVRKRLNFRKSACPTTMKYVRGANEPVREVQKYKGKGVLLRESTFT